MTRRHGWWKLKPGDILIACEKHLGMEGKECIQICRIRIISTRTEQLCDVSDADIIREGYDDLTKDQFISMCSTRWHIEPSANINRIEFAYLSQTGV